MTSIIISIVGICIAIFSFVLTFYNFRRDKAEIKFHYDIMDNKVRILYINIGRRPTCIKTIGYFDWTLGSYLTKGGENFEITLKEGEFGYYDIDIENNQFWEIKSFFIEDHFGKRWEKSEKEMWYFYEMTYNTILGKLSKLNFSERRKDSMKSYLAFLDKNKYTNENEMIRKFRQTGEL